VDINIQGIMHNKVAQVHNNTQEIIMETIQVDNKLAEITYHSQIISKITTTMDNIQVAPISLIKVIQLSINKVLSSNKGSLTQVSFNKELNGMKMFNNKRFMLKNNNKIEIVRMKA